MINLIFTKAIIASLMATSFVIPSFANVSLAPTKEAQEKTINYVSYEEKDEPTFDIYYDDCFFDHDATTYSPRLAALSIFMAKYTMNRHDAPIDQGEEAVAQFYLDQPKRLEKFFNLIEFDNYSYNADYQARTGFDTIGIACASKVIGDYTVIAVTIRSGGYALEWSNNMWLGDGSKSDMMHEGWYNCANKTVAFVENYIKTLKIEGGVKLWLSGFSRGGAVINLTTAFIDQKIYEGKYNVFEDAPIHIEKKHVYAYTFETPQGANIYSKTMLHPHHEAYNNIFNVINPNDLVPKVAMSAWGFTRFGVDKFITTEFFDPKNFESNRSIFNAMYKHHKDEEFNGDKMQAYQSSGIFSLLNLSTTYTYYETLISVIQGATGSLPYWLEEDPKKVNFDANTFLTVAIDKGCELIGSRDDYADDYQEIIKDVILQFVSDNPSADEYTLKKSIWHLVLEIVSYIPFYTIPAIILNLTATDSNIDWYRLAPVLNLLKEAYNEMPTEILSIGLNIGNIMDNHGTNFNVIHVCAQEQLYIDHYNEVLKRDDLRVVPLLNNAAFQRFTFKDFNQLELFEYQAPNKVQIAQVEGKNVIAGEVKYCNKGVALGLYTYNVSNFMELFLPANKSYRIETKSISMKPVHEVYMHGLLYNTNVKDLWGDAYYRQDVPERILDQYFWFDSDYFYIDVPKKIN